MDHVIIYFDIPNHHNNLYDVLKIHVLVFRDSFGGPPEEISYEML